MRFAGYPVDPQHAFIAGSDLAARATAGTRSTITATTATPSCRASASSRSPTRTCPTTVTSAAACCTAWSRCRAGGATCIACACISSLHERGRNRQLEAISGKLEELGLARSADHHRRRFQRLAPSRHRDPRAAPRHDRGLGRAPRQGARDVPEPAAGPQARSHLRARLQVAGAGAPRQALVAALRPSRAERGAGADLGDQAQVAAPARGPAPPETHRAGRRTPLRGPGRAPPSCGRHGNRAALPAPSPGGRA